MRLRMKASSLPPTDKRGRVVLAALCLCCLSVQVVSAQTGEYFEGDGTRTMFSANGGFRLGDNGFLNAIVVHVIHLAMEESWFDNRSDIDFFLQPI